MLSPEHDSKLRWATRKNFTINENHAVHCPGLAYSSQVMMGFYSRPPLHLLPERKVIWRDLEKSLSMTELESWAGSVGIKLGPLIPDLLRRLKVLQLYTYRHLNGNDLTDLPCTDLIMHRACLKKDTKPASV